MGMMRSMAAAAVLLAACATQTVHVTRDELRRHARELERDGYATVNALEGGRQRLSAGRVIDTATGGRTDRRGVAREPVTPRRVSVGELVAHCADGAPCLLDDVTTDRIAIGRRRKPDPNRATKLLGFAMSAGLAGYCLAACDDPAATFATAGLVGGYLLFIQPFGALR